MLGSQMPAGGIPSSMNSKSSLSSRFAALFPILYQRAAGGQGRGRGGQARITEARDAAHLNGVS